MSIDIKIHVMDVIDMLESHDYRVDEDGSDVTAWDYLTDALDIEYIVSNELNFLGAIILVSYGGPSIRVNTRTMEVIGHWWGDSYTESFRDNLGVHEAAEELYECIQTN